MCVYSQEPDVEKLEQKINCGQIEEVIAQVLTCWLQTILFISSVLQEILVYFNVSSDQ